MKAWEHSWLASNPGSLFWISQNLKLQDKFQNEEPGFEAVCCSAGGKMILVALEMKLQYMYRIFKASTRRECACGAPGVISLPILERLSVKLNLTGATVSV